MTLGDHRLGKTTKNVCNKAFDGRFRADRLHAQWFLTFAAETQDTRRSFQNEERPPWEVGAATTISRVLIMTPPARHADRGPKTPA